MRILTELSGYGHYGVWSLVPPEIIEEFNNSAASFPEWQSPQFFDNPPSRTGIDYSLIYKRSDEEPLIRLGWSPFHLAEAMKSISILSRFAPIQTSQDREKHPFSDPALELIAYPNSNGWDVKANFGDPIWDVIETPAFQEMLPAINRQIQLWWQDQNNTEMRGQFATVFGGVDGPTLQVYQPSGDGLWIVGSRQHKGGSYQLTDHNTDCSTDAFAHVYSLCVILDHCRQSLQKQPPQFVELKGVVTPELMEILLDPCGRDGIEDIGHQLVGPGQDFQEYEDKYG